jgi:hypothetical protein
MYCTYIVIYPAGPALLVGPVPDGILGHYPLYDFNAEADSFAAVAAFAGAARQVPSGLLGPGYLSNVQTEPDARFYPG